MFGPSLYFLENIFAVTHWRSWIFSSVTATYRSWWVSGICLSIFSCSISCKLVVRSRGRIGFMFVFSLSLFFCRPISAVLLFTSCWISWRGPWCLVVFVCCCGWSVFVVDILFWRNDTSYGKWYLSQCRKQSTIEENHSFALGRRAQAPEEPTFVFNPVEDSQDEDTLLLWVPLSPESCCQVSWVVCCLMMTKHVQVSGISLPTWLFLLLGVSKGFSHLMYHVLKCSCCRLSKVSESFGVWTAAPRRLWVCSWWICGFLMTVALCVSRLCLFLSPPLSL